MPTGQLFVNGLKDPKKSWISFLVCSLQQAFDSFDFTMKRSALLVYFEPSEQNKTLYEVHFLQDFGQEIQKNFAFIGVNEHSKEQGLIAPQLPRKDVPVVIAYMYDELGKLVPLEALPLTLENLKNRPMIRAYLQKMAETAQKVEETFSRGAQSLQQRVSQQARAQNAHPDHFEEQNMNSFGDDPYEQEQLMEELRLKKQFSTDRRMKNDQDKAYEETLKKIEEERRKQQAEAEAKQAEAEAAAAKQRERDELKRRIDSEKSVDPQFAIALQFRFPSGQKTVREFDRRSTVGYAHMFASMFDNKGFENDESDFNLFAGFPKKKLEKDQTLESVFGNSDSEVVHVEEV